MRIYCTVWAINSQRAVNIQFWSDSIASSFCHLFAWKKFPKHFVVSINVPPPQLWGGEHTKICFNHVSVLSQSVTRIRLSHTIFWFGVRLNGFLFTVSPSHTLPFKWWTIEIGNPPPLSKKLATSLMYMHVTCLRNEIK